MGKRKRNFLKNATSEPPRLCHTAPVGFPTLRRKTHDLWLNKPLKIRVCEFDDFLV
jgi:hypothetical protein